MKNKTYITGLLSTIFIILGGLFKLQHLPGASILLMLGIFFLCIVFLPAATISSYKENGRKRSILYIAIFITIFFDFVGALFKIMHWPGAGKLMILGITFPIIVFLPVYLYYHFKDREESQTNFLYVMFLLVYLSVMSALLSLGPSNEILTDAARTESIVNLNDYYSIKKEEKQHDAKISELRQRTAALIDFIGQLKKEMVLEADKVNEESIKPNGDVEIFFVMQKDDKNAPAEVLFGRDNADELKNNIGRYRQFLLEQTEGSNPVSLDLLKTDHSPEGSSWAGYHFGNLPLVVVLQNLTNLESNIILAELEAISLINNNNLAKNEQ